MTVPGAAPPLEPLRGGPRQIGPFTATALIGAGRRTIAYLGHRGRTEEPLVLREPHKGLDPEVFEAEVEGSRSFDPARALEVTRHPGGIVAHDRAAVGESVATILEQAIGIGRPIDLDIALAIAMGIAQRLAKSGERRVHGDLVPHHVIVCYDGEVQLIDPAGAAHRERAKAPSRAGYRAPELVKADALGPYTDVFALGVLLFEMTTASRLFAFSTLRETDAAIVEGRLPRPRDLVDGYPIELQLILRKLLRPAPAGRFQDGDRASDALRLVAASRNAVSALQLGAWLGRTFPDRQATWQKLVGDRANAIMTAFGRSDTIPRGSIPNDRTEPVIPAYGAQASDPHPTDARPAPQSLGGSEEATFDDIPRLKPALRHRGGGAVETPRTDDLGIEASRAPTPSRRATILGAAIHGIVAESPTLITRVRVPGPKNLPDPEPGSPRLRSIRPQEALYAETPTPLMEVDFRGGPPSERDAAAARIDVLLPMSRLDEAPHGATPTPTVEVEGEGEEDRREPTPDPSPPAAPETKLDQPLAHWFSDAGVGWPGGLEREDPASLPTPAPEIDDDPDWADSFVIEGPITPDIDEDKSEEDKPIADVASDLLLPERPAPAATSLSQDLTSDLADPKLGAGETAGARSKPEVLPRTGRAWSSQASTSPPAGETRREPDVNDTIDEGWALDELPPALVAHVLHASDSNLPSDDELVVPRPDLSDEDLDEISREIAREREVVGPGALDLDAGPRTPRVASPSPSPSPGTPQPPRGRPGIPPSNTMPAAAKPTLVFGATVPARAKMGELWAPAPSLGPSAGSEANVATQIVRERVVPAGSAPVAAEDWVEPEPASRRNVPQSRVPTMIVRERLIRNSFDPSSTDSAPQDHLREDSSRDDDVEREVSEPTTLDDAVHLVIPIPDDELDRAARKKRALSIAGIVLMIFVLVVLVAFVLVTHLTGDEITLNPPVIAESIEESETPPPAGSQVAKRAGEARVEPHAVTGPAAAPVAAPIGVRTSTESAPARDEGIPAPTQPAFGGEGSANPLRAGSTSSAVRISVRPKNAKIMVGGRPAKNDSSIEIGPEPLEVLITLPGYEDEKRTIHPGDSKPLYVLMKKRHAP